MGAFGSHQPARINESGYWSRRFAPQNPHSPEWMNLVQAIWGGSDEEFEALFLCPNREAMDANKMDPYGWSLLHHASHYDRVTVAGFLLQGQADVNLQSSENGDTPLHVAAANGGVALMTMLLEQHADPFQTNASGRTVLMNAARSGHCAATSFLLDKGVDPNFIDLRVEDSSTALMDAAKNGHVEVVTLLLQAGANPNIVDKDGCTALHLAVRRLRVDVVALLLDTPDVNATVQDNRGRSPLQHLEGYGIWDEAKRAEIRALFDGVDIRVCVKSAAGGRRNLDAIRPETNSVFRNSRASESDLRQQDNKIDAHPTRNEITELNPGNSEHHGRDPLGSAATVDELSRVGDDVCMIEGTDTDTELSGEKQDRDEEGRIDWSYLEGKSVLEAVTRIRAVQPNARIEIVDPDYKHDSQIHVLRLFVLDGVVIKAVWIS